MKRKLCFFIMMSFLFSSCLFEEEDIFEESSAVRKQAALEEYTDLLISATNGWLFEYYPHPSQAYGGWNYIVKFSEGDTVYVSCEFGRDPAILTSFHQVTYDYGAMLTFDTYNEYLHYFAEARNTTTLYQGYQGDYEFMLMDYDDAAGTLKLKGKRTTNYMTLQKLPADTSWEEYLDGVNVTEAILLFSDYRLLVDGSEAGTVTLSDRLFTFRWTEGEESMSVIGSAIYRPDGYIHFYSPVEIAGVEVQNFRYDGQTNTATSVDQGTNVVFEATVPDDFAYYEDYLGEWTLTDYYGSSYTVMFEQDVINKSFKMTSDQLAYPVYWDWSATNSGRRLTLYTQVLNVTDEGNLVLLMPAYRNASGNTSFYTSIGSSAAYYTLGSDDSTLTCTGGTSSTITGFIFFIRNSGNTGNVGWGPSPNYFINGTLTKK